MVAFLLIAWPAIAGAAITLPPEDQKWIRLRTPRFTIISSAGERQTQEIGERLETLAASLRQVNERFERRSIETRVLVLGRRRDGQEIFDALLKHDTNAPGVFIAHPDGSGSMMIDAGREWDRTLVHELTHNLLAGGGARLPLWLEEGIAEYFSTAKIKGRQIVLGQAIVEHQRLLWNRTPIPLKDVFNAPRSTPLLNNSMFYPESWGTVDWMMRNGRARFYRFLADVDGGMSSSAALHKHFGVNEGFIERAIKKPAMTPAPTMTVRLESVEHLGAAEMLSRSDSLYEIGSFLSALDLNPDAATFFEAALTSDAANARSLAALASLRIRQKHYEAALPLFERAVRVTPDDPVVLLGYSEALMRISIGSHAASKIIDADDATRVRKARELAERALRHGGDTARANAVAGASYLVEQNVAPGIALLESAKQARPERSDIALNLYALYLRAGDRPRADALFEERFAHARNEQVTMAARTILIQDQLAVANRYLVANEFSKAEAIVEELAALPIDSESKEDLQIQLSRLKEVSTANRQIVAFNDAVSAANRGETEAALKMINELLVKATDERVITDGKNLRAMLERRLARANR